MCLNNTFYNTNNLNNTNQSNYYQRENINKSFIKKKTTPAIIKKYYRSSSCNHNYNMGQNNK